MIGAVAYFMTSATLIGPMCPSCCARFSTHRQMLKNAGVSSPEESSVGSWGILTKPASMHAATKLEMSDMPNSKAAYHKEYYLKNRERLNEQSATRYWSDRERKAL
jgi:hypothetical protein